MSESLTATAAQRVETTSAAQEFFEDVFRDRGGDRAAEAVRLLLDDDRDDEPGIVRRGEGDEPGVVEVAEPELRRSRLARHLDARDLGARAGAGLDDELHHLVQLRGGPRLDRVPQYLRRGLGDRGAVG